MGNRAFGGLLLESGRPVQAKLQVGSSEDPLEHQADAAADRVMRKCAGACECYDCKERSVARKLEGGAHGGGRPAPRIVHDVVGQSGSPLDAATRAFFEPRFGRDFSSVRVHAGPQADSSARAIQALAYTSGQDVVFAEGQYDPASDRGRRLLAHELAHTIQQSGNAGEVLQRQPADTIDVDLVAVDPKEAEELRERGIDLPKVSEETYKKLAKAPPSPVPAKAPTGFVSGAAGAAPCPDAPDVTTIPANCPPATPAPGSAPPAKETAELPTLDDSAFGGDSKVESFAGDLADCRAARVVDAEVAKRYKTAVDAAKKSSTAEVKADTEKSMADAVAGVDPKDKAAVAAARKEAGKTAKAAADKKIADAQATVQKQDPKTVKTELAGAFKEDLKTDFKDTMHAALKRFGATWRNHMIADQNKAKKRLVIEKSAKPKVKKGETPPAGKPAEQIASETEAELTVVRCIEQNWAVNQIEKLKRGWMVGRREKVDFDTITQQAAWLKDFKPGRTVADVDRVPIPDSLKSDKDMPGVAPEVAQFLTALEALEPNFKAGNYSGHGGGSFAGAGFSVDLTLSGKKGELDKRGFYLHDNAVNFLLNLNQAANAMGGKWRVLYNDFLVAEEVNHATGSRNVEYTANIDKGGNLNWHGPLVLHFHLDIQLPPPPPAPAPTQAPTPTPAPTPVPASTPATQ
jgi:hypothetical protein